MKLINLGLIFSLAGTLPAFSAITILTEDFSNSNDPDTTDVAVSGWNVSLNSTFLLESGDPDDSAGADGIADGYASLNGNVTANGANFSPSATLSLGVIELSDVGGTISVNFDYLEVNAGASVVSQIRIGGSEVTMDSASTFGGNPNSGTISLSYQVLAGDVGQETVARFQFFSSSDARVIGLDRLQVNFTPVPEPGAVMLLGLGLPLIGLRRRRSQR